jgi:hypothetical protein
MCSRDGLNLETAVRYHIQIAMRFVLLCYQRKLVPRFWAGDPSISGRDKLLATHTVYPDGEECD